MQVGERQADAIVFSERPFRFHFDTRISCLLRVLGFRNQRGAILIRDLKVRVLVVEHGNI